jgi:glutathione S-transferase
MTITLYELAAADPERRFSPYCWRTRFALAHKDLRVETVPWRFVEKDVLKPTDQGRVPVVVDRGRWVNDSWAIADYLEDAYSDRPTLFGGAAGRAAARFVNSWADTVMLPGLGPMLMHDIWRQAHEGDKAYFRQSREERYGATLEALHETREQRLAPFRQSLQPLRLTLEKQPFLGGTLPFYPDYIAMGGFMLARSISELKLLEPSDPIYAWRERMLDLFGGMGRKAKGYAV